MLLTMLGKVPGVKWEHWLNDKHPRVVMVALVHMVLLVYGMFLTAQDMIVEQYPLSLHELTYVIGYYFVQFMLVGLVLAGTKKKLPLLYTPWLATFLAIFATATCIWIKSILSASTLYIGPLLTNLIILGLSWLGWYIVSKEFVVLFFRSKTRYRIWT